MQCNVKSLHTVWSFEKWINVRRADLIETMSITIVSESSQFFPINSPQLKENHFAIFFLLCISFTYISVLKTSWNWQYIIVVFSWIISFRKASAWFMHVVACFSSLFLFMSKCKYSELFINPLIDIYLAYFYCLTVVNRVAMNILTDICLNIHFHSSWINTQKRNAVFLGQLYVTLYNTLPQNFPFCEVLYTHHKCVSVPIILCS